VSMRINVNLYPKDGYVFRENDGTLHRSHKGWKDVIARVTSYRKVNGLPIGNPEQEVHDQACRNNPTYCSEANPLPPVPTTRISLKGMVISWMANLRRLSDKVQMVPPALAKERAEVCAKCPFNVALKEGCAPCKAFVSESRNAILKGRSVDGRLNACEKFTADAATLVHIDEPTVEKPDLPDHCWKKRKPPQ
jgi:hypothetical protein